MVGKRIDLRSKEGYSLSFMSEEQLFLLFKEALLKNPNLSGKNYFEQVFGEGSYGRRESEIIKNPTSESI